MNVKDGLFFLAAATFAVVLVHLIVYNFEIGQTLF